MLTERQTRLLSHLQANTDRFLTQIEIVTALRNNYPHGENFTAETFHDSVVRQMLTRDIRAINKSDDVDVVIISTNKGIKIADETEFDTYIRRQYEKVFRMLSLVRKQERKGRLNNQLRITADGSFHTVRAYAKMRKERKMKAVDVVDFVKKTDPRFDGSLLSKIENGVCEPTVAQEMALITLLIGEKENDTL